MAHKDLVDGLPNLSFKNNILCDAFQKRKQVKASFKSKNIVSTDPPLQLLHIDLFGPSRNVRLGGIIYALVIVDDYSQYAWIKFLSHKRDEFAAIRKLIEVI